MNYALNRAPSHLLLMTVMVWVALLYGPQALASYISFPNHSRAKLVTSHSQVKPGETFWVGLHILLEPEWHTYWKNPGDSGAAAWIEMSSAAGAQFGEIEWPTPVRIPTPPLMTYGYDNQVLLRAQVTPPATMRPGSTLSLQWETEWLVCKVECIPAVHTFTLDLPVAEETKVSADFNLVTSPDFQRYPPETALQASYQLRGSQIVVRTAELPENFDFFPESTVHISTARPERAGSTFTLKLHGDWPGGKVSGLLINEDTGEARRVEALPERLPLLSFLLGAFLGGLLLNLMPCVFPIVSLKIFSALNGGARERWAHLCFVLGALVSFSAIALILVALKAAGHHLGWGFQLQSAPFVLFLVVLFFVLALSFLGVFDIQLPGLGAPSGNGLAGSFMTGALAVVVASPCTAPFMGAAMGFALTQTTVTLLAVFLSLGLGFAFPYLLLAIHPSLLSRVPKSGPWLETFKELMFFPMVWTALWLLWIYAQLTSITAAIWALAGLSGIAGVIWWRSKSRGKAARATGAAVFAVVALFAFWQSSTAPLETPSLAGSSSDIQWTPFDEEILQSLLAQGTPLFVDFTASWCITCKVNDRVTFGSEEVVEFVRTENIHMMKADWTKRDPQITKYLQRYGRISVPFYLYWPSGMGQPLILPEILTPQIFMNQIKSYQNRQGDST